MNRFIHLTFTLLCCCFFSTKTHAQSTLKLTGTVLDSADKSPVVGAYVMLTKAGETTDPKYVTTDQNGKFAFENLPKQRYDLKITYLSYSDLTKTISLSNETTDAGNFLLQESAKTLKEVKVTGQINPSEQKGDTTQFNAAAFKTNPDATTEDLIQKMPGISIENGAIKAQGETVQKVLVDGKPFFGEDPSLALKNLPAEVVDKIEVFDRLTDQAQFTGFDDGNAQKTINIVTKPNRRIGQFGKVYGGYGLDERYTAGGNVNFFKGERRLSVIGLSNNINQQNFSNQDLLGVTGRGGGGSNNFLVNQQSGLTGTNAFGLNYSDKWGKKVTATGSYFFNRSVNSNSQTNFKETFLTDSAIGNQFYDETSTSGSTNSNHRVDLRIEYEINKNNSLIFTPRISFQNNRSHSSRLGLTTLGINTPINSTNNSQSNKNSGYNLNNDILFRHRFAKQGRTISFNFGTSINDQDGRGSLYAMNQYNLNAEAIGDTIDQRSFRTSNGIRLSGNANYTEPLSKTSQLQLNYSVSVNNSNSMKETYNWDPFVNRYSDLDSILSNNFDNRYVTNRGGVGYRYRNNNGWFASASLDFQNTGLYSDQLSPVTTTVSQNFFNVMPNAMISHRSKGGNQLRIFYRTSTSQPSISQLQNVINNSNPLFLSAGNPDLKQQFSNTLNVRYNATSSDKTANLTALLYMTKTNSVITNSTFIAQAPTEIADGIILERGGQLTKPVNLDGAYNVRSLITYGRPMKPIKVNLNLTTGFNYARSPGLINNVSNFSNNYSINQGVVLSSNISEKLDFTLSYSGYYNIVRNTIQPRLNNNYYTQSGQARINWMFGKGFVVQTDLANQSYRGLGAGFNQNFTLWNASLGKKFLKNNAGELRLTVFDILNQNNSVSRTVTETFIQDNTSQVLTQYAMLTFTYTLRNFGKAPAPSNSDRRGDFGPRGEGGGFERGGFDRGGGGPR
jgi:hypothetical protein